MSDSLQTLKYGHGKPMFWLYNNRDEELVIDDLFEQGLTKPVSNFVKSFDYIYDEENDDECTIKLMFTQPSQLDYPFFEEDTILKVQWGYVEPGGIIIKSPIRKIAIRDIIPIYNKSGITLILKCTDLVSYLSRVRDTHKSDSNNFADWLQEILSDQYKATISIEGKKLAMTQGESRPFEYDDNGKLHAMDNARIFQDEFIQFSPTSIIGKSKSIKAEILERLNGSKKGPAYLDGRDDSINTVVRDYNQKPWVAYTVAGGFGEVVSWRAKSNLAKTKDDAGQTATVNPKTKEIEATTINTPSPTPDSTQPTEAELEQVHELLEETWEHNIQNPDDQKPVNEFTFKRTVHSGPYASVSNIDGNTSVYTGLKSKPLKFSIDAKTVLNMPGFLEEQRKAIARNYMLRKIERKFECDVVVVGDPSLITSKVYLFEGLSKRDSGNWYAVKIVHSLDFSKGYICKINAIRRPKLVGVQYLKRTTKIIIKGDKVNNKVDKEVTKDKAFETDTKKDTKDLKKFKLEEPRSEFDKSLDRIENINEESKTLSTLDLDTKVKTDIIDIKPNIENV